MRPTTLAFATFALAVAALVAPLTAHGGPAMEITSPAFAPNGEIPAAHTCEGADRAPALTFANVPPGAKSLALIVDDPDAPAGTWVHWVMWNIPAATHLLPENVPKSGQLNSGAIQGRNDFGKTGYNGPCPPPGKTHRYYFRLYALDVKLTLQPGVTRQEVDAAMKGHIIGKAEHMGTYRR